MPTIETRIVRLDERLPKPRPGCNHCRDWPPTRQCGELMGATCMFPDECPRCGRKVTYELTRCYLGGISPADV